MSYGLFKINRIQGSGASMADEAEAALEQKPAFRDEELTITDVVEAITEKK